MVSQGQIDRIADAISRIPATNPSYIAVGQETLGDVLSQGMIRKIAQVATKVETRAMIGYANENDVMADEIERLRSKVEKWETAYAMCDRSRDGFVAEIERMRTELDMTRNGAEDEIERLRRALQAILDDPEASINITAYARTALQT